MSKSSLKTLNPHPTLAYLRIYSPISIPQIRVLIVLRFKFLWLFFGWSWKQTSLSLPVNSDTYEQLRIYFIRFFSTKIPSTKNNWIKFLLFYFYRKTYCKKELNTTKIFYYKTKDCCEGFVKTPNNTCVSKYM